MIVLNTVADLLRVTTSAATAVDVLVSFVDTTTTTTVSGRQRTSIAGIGTNTVCASPGAGVERVIKNATFNCRGGANNLLVQWTDGTAEQLLGGAAGVVLGAGDTLIYTDTEGWRVQDLNGAVKTLTSAAISAHVIDVNSVAFTQRAILNFIDTAAVSWAGTDNGVSGATEVRASVIAHSITAALQTQMPANTIKAEATGALADEQNIALAVQQTLIRSAGNIVAVTAAAGQVLGRTAAGGNLGFIVPPGALLRAPQFITATNAAFAHPTGMAFFLAIGVGSGGGGSGAAAVAGAVGSGGNAGNWGMKVFTSISGTSNITIGAAGTTGSGAAGGNGSACSIVHNAVTFSLTGGVGGTILAGAGTIAAAVINAANGANTGADLDMLGERGTPGWRFSAAATSTLPGAGGSNPFGAGGPALAALVAGAGLAASGHGAGGGGGAAPAGVAVAGGAATAGCFVLYEFG